ncbi:MAG: hypothetical protein ACO1QB_16780, partial [Verrucomicrobiales bacterium]
DISKKENVEIEEAALFAIARGAEGGMRDAESTLDQLISFCGNKITEADVLSMFGLTARAQLLALAKAMLEGDASQALQELNDLARNGKDLSRLLSDLLAHFRNLLVFQVSNKNSGLLDVSEAEMADLNSQVQQLGSDTLTRIMEILSQAEGRLRDAASKKIFLEVTLLKAIEARKAVSIDTVLKRLQQMRAEGGGGGQGGFGLPDGAKTQPAERAAAPKAAAAARPAAPEPVAAPARSVVVAPEPEPSLAPLAPRETTGLARQAAEAMETPSYESNVQTIPPFETLLTEKPTAPAPAPRPSGDLPQLWSQLLEAVGRASGFLKTYLLEAHPVTITPSLLTIGYDPEFSEHIALVDNSKNKLVLQTKLSELGYRDAQVKFIVAPTPSGWVRPVAQEAAPDTATLAASTPRPGTTGSARKLDASGKPVAPAPAPVLLNMDEFKNDPLIKKALEIFKGQIVEVRA